MSISIYMDLQMYLEQNIDVASLFRTQAAYSCYYLQNGKILVST